MSDPRLELGPQLTGTDAEQCQAALDAVRPIIRVGGGLSPAAAGAAAALAHLLGRIHPHTTIDGDAELGPNPWSAATVASAAELVPSPAATRAPGHDLVIGVGDVDDAALWIGGDDWNAAVANHSVDVTATDLALGVHAAACIAAAEVLKQALAPLGLIHASALPTTVWNLVDYSRSARRPPDAAVTSLAPIALLGAGSVGSSVGALLGMTGPGGRVDVVDPDTFDPHRNPYRYPASVPNTGGAKAAWVAAVLSSAGWDARAHTAAVASWNTGKAQPGFDGVAVSSVDRVDARADVADVLARTTLSIGVSGLAFHVQREHPDDGYACPYCQFLGVGTPMSQLAIYEKQTGIGMARVVELLAGAPLAHADVEAAVAGGRIHPDHSGEMVGRRFEDLVRRAYSQATVSAPSGAAIAVSAPSVSWLAATIAVAEIRKAQKSLPTLDRRVDLDLSGSPTGIVRRVGRDRSGRCLCANPFRVRAARTLYEPD